MRGQLHPNPSLFVEIYFYYPRKTWVGKAFHHQDFKTLKMDMKLHSVKLISHTTRTYSSHFVLLWNSLHGNHINVLIFLWTAHLKFYEYSCFISLILGRCFSQWDYSALCSRLNSTINFASFSPRLHILLYSNGYFFKIVSINRDKHHGCHRVSFFVQFNSFNFGHYAVKKFAQSFVRKLWGNQTISVWIFLWRKFALLTFLFESWLVKAFFPSVCWHTLLTPRWKTQ